MKAQQGRLWGNLRQTLPARFPSLEQRLEQPQRVRGNARESSWGWLGRPAHQAAAALPVPVGKRHHDMQGGQHQAEVKEGIAVGDAILFIVIGSALTDGHLLLSSLCCTLLCLHQAVHLPVVRGSQAVGEEGRWLGPQTQQGVAP